MEARVEERHALADRGRCGLFARDKLLEERVGVVHLSAAVGEVGHVAENPGLRLGGDGEVDGRGAEEPGDAPVGDVGAAVLVHHHPVALGERALPGGEQAALRPLVEGAVLEVPFAAAFDRLKLAALGAVLEFVRRHVHMLGGLV